MSGNILTLILKVITGIKPINIIYILGMSRLTKTQFTDPINSDLIYGLIGCIYGLISILAFTDIGHQ